jgi:predicted CoA-binding protein
MDKYMGKFAGIETGNFSLSTRDILLKYKNIAMVGLSPEPSRPSYRAAIHMKSQGYKIFPVNPNYEEILGLRCYKSLKDIPEPVEIVDIFRKPEDVPPIVEEAIAIGAKVIWMQLGIINEEAAKRAREAGLEVVMDRCVKIEHCRFFQGLNLVGLNTGVITSRKI